MGEFPVDTLPCVAEVGEFPVDTLPCVAEVGEFPVDTLPCVAGFAEVPVDDAPRSRPPGVAYAARCDVQPPSGGFRVIVFGVAFEPRNEVGGAAFLQPCEPCVIVDFSDGPMRVLRDGSGVELDGAPHVDEPPVRVVQRFDAAPFRRGACEQDGGGPSEGFDVAADVAECVPHCGCCAALPSEVGERCCKCQGSASVPVAGGDG